MAAYVSRLFESGTVDLKSVQNVTLVPAMSGKVFIPIRLIGRRVSNSGAGAEALINVGVTSANYTDIFDSRSFSLGVLANIVEQWTPDNVVDSGGLAVSLANPIILRVGTASGRTTDTAQFWLEGIVV